MKPAPLAAAWIACLVLAACASGPARRVSEPAASIQQLSVRADGTWTVDLRLQNYSSIPMRFTGVDLTLATGDAAAGRLQGSAGITIGPESADIVSLPLTPSSTARIVVADALARGRSVAYAVEGTLEAVPEDRGSGKRYEIKRTSVLTPVPGLAGVLR